jgi:hypothetical protein
MAVAERLNFLISLCAGADLESIESPEISAWAGMTLGTRQEKDIRLNY